MQGVVPVFSRSPGAVERAGPALGELYAEVFGELGFSNQKQEHFRKHNII
jgi:crotonobetainyl-CoA:carnitine CoA-transferase CaiB-like acyl-CoA transferase